jgi:hypothetical protein
MAEFQLSQSERGAIQQLKALARTWPKSLWLYSASGSLCVMRKVNGNRVMNTKSGGVGLGFDSDYIVEQINGIDNDGGDW